MQPTNPTLNQAPPPPNAFYKALFGGWLAKALTIIILISSITVSGALLADMFYQRALINMNSTTPGQALSEFSSPISPTESPFFQNFVPQGQTGTTIPTISGQTATPTIHVTQSPHATNTPTHIPNATNTPTHAPTSPPQATNTQPPTSTPTTAQIAGCYVIVSGYLYNMAGSIGVIAHDPNTGKTHTHTTIDYTCGTQANPTDMTDTYLEKHSPMGCAARIAPYIVTPPAPQDPTCA